MKARLASYMTLAGSAAVAQGMLLLISPIVTRLYDPEDVGAFGVVMGLGALVGSVGTGRLEHAVPIARDSGEAVQIAVLAALLALLTSIASTILVAVAIQQGVGMDSKWQAAPLIAIPAIAFSLAMFQVTSALLLRRRSYRGVGLTKVHQGAVTGAGQLLLGWVALGAAGLVWAQVMGYLAGSWRGLRGLQWRVRAVVRARGLQLRATFDRYRRFPLVLAPAALFNLAAQHWPVLALGYLFGLYEAGLYALVARVCGAPLGLVGQAVSQVYASEFRAYLETGGGALARKYARMLWHMFAVGLVLVGALVFVMFLWGTQLFGARWANIGTVSLLVSPMLLTDFATTPTSMTLGYLGHERTQLIWDIGRFVAIVAVFAAAAAFSLRFGQLLVLFSAVWSVCLLVHVGLTYRACLSGARRAT